MFSSSIVKTLEFPIIPKKVELSDLKQNRKLFDDASIALIKHRLADQKDNTRFSKHNPLLKDPVSNEESAYSVIKSGGKYYAVYKGEKHKKLIGKGSSGKVKFVQDLDTGKWYAMKIQTRMFGNDAVIDNEWKVLKDIHMNVSDAIEYSSAKNHDKKSAMIIPYIPGLNLESYILAHTDKTSSELSPLHFVNIAIQLLRAVNKFHNKYKYWHRDIKLGNFIYNKIKNKLVLIDFGDAIKSNNGIEIQDFLRGTTGFMAPELKEVQKKWNSWSLVRECCISYFNNKDIPPEPLATYSIKTELYAVGKCLKLLFGIDPFVEVINRFYKITESHYTNTGLSENQEIIHFLNEMTDDVADKRSSIDEAIQFLEKIRQHCPPKPQVKVGVINLNDIRKYTSKEVKQVITALKLAVDEVVIIDTNAKLDDEVNAYAIQINRQLEKYGLQVANKMFVSNTKDLSSIYANIDFYYKTKDKEAITPPLIRSFNHDPSEVKASIKYVLDTRSFLINEISRLENKYAYDLQKPIRATGKLIKKRIGCLISATTYLDEQYKNDRLTIPLLLLILDEAAKQMTSTSRISDVCLIRFFSRTSTGTRNINRLRNEIACQEKIEKAIFIPRSLFI